MLLKYMEKWPGFVRHIYSLIIILFGWVIFASDEWPTFVSFVRGFFVPSTGFWSSMGIYELTTHLIILAIGIIGSTRLPMIAYEKLFKIKDNDIENGRSAVAVVSADIYLLIVLLLCIATLVGDSYNPFLYFRF